MTKKIEGWERRGERFWRAHHEAWKGRSLNQREHCEVQRNPQKAFENWRQIFWREPLAPGAKLLFRSSGLRHSLSDTLSHVAYSSSAHDAPPAHEGRRRPFSALDRQRLLAEGAELTLLRLPALTGDRSQGLADCRVEIARQVRPFWIEVRPCG